MGDRGSPIGQVADQGPLSAQFPSRGRRLSRGHVCYTASYHHRKAPWPKRWHLYFEKARLGDGLARDAVYKLAFHRLRVIASALLRRERAGHTLQPTALVSELFLKLHRLETTILSEDHFFRISARAMRQVLIDHARVKRPAQKVSIDRIPELLLPSSPECGQPRIGPGRKDGVRETPIHGSPGGRDGLGCVASRA